MDYFKTLEGKLQEAYACASAARSKGLDPTDEVEIKIAKDVAARVEGIVGPEGISTVIRDMEKSGMTREAIAFEIARKLAAGEIIKGSKEQLIEQAVRTSVGILTEGVLVAPTEGISKVKIKNNPDGSEYVAVYYSGPIRSAGGTVAALSVVLADIARRTAGISDYRPTDSQVERYVEEMNIYESRVAHLQYKPPDDDVRLITKNCPVCIDGEPTEDMEVSVQRNIAGVETNRIRGGIPLVICEGIAQKSSKLFKYTKKLELGWDWIEKIIKITRKADRIEIKPDFTYLEGLVAGRPVFAYPSTKGGFRLRYGRSRTNGIMAKNVHPATMVLVDDFLAYGTQMKIERPGKGCVVASCESIEPPVVKLRDGSVVRVKTLAEARRLRPQVDEILFLGDLLIAYGDFLKSNHPLIPGGWCEEWWAKEVEAKGAVPPEKIASDPAEAFEFSATHGVPLHPAFTFAWESLKRDDLVPLAKWLAAGEMLSDGGRISSLRLKKSEEKKYLEELYAEHAVKGDMVVLDGGIATALLMSMGMLKEGRISADAFEIAVMNMPNAAVHEILEKLSGVKIKPFAPIYIGARMGRPEKAKERPMEGSPNVLFPTGSQKNRSLTKLYRMLKGREKENTVNLEIARFKCRGCGNITFTRKCELCGADAVAEKACQKCGAVVNVEIHCDMKTVPYDMRPVAIADIMDAIKKKIGVMPEDVKAVKGLSNPTKMPERLEKGFLRAKHGVFVFRDGTSRFDATDVPLTHFIPAEIGLSLEKARELGYDKDYLGNELASDRQLVALRHQDVLVSERGADYFLRVSKFIDDLLVELYGLKPFYNLEKPKDLIGHMAVGLSPHTSAGALCRIIGITKANVGYAHPYFHTAKRRNCFGKDEKIPVMLPDGSWRLLRMKELVEDELEKRGRDWDNAVKRDDFGTLYRPVKGLKTITFNRNTGKYEIAEIDAVSKHPRGRDLIDVETAKGRRITVTADHPLVGMDFEKTSAETADAAVCPLSIDIPENDTVGIDAAAFVEDVMVKSKSDLLAGPRLKELAKKLDLRYKTLTNYRYRRSYPVGLLKKLGIALPRSARLFAKRDTVAIKRSIETGEDFFFLLGFWLAEGYSRKTPKKCYQICFTVTKKEFKRMLVEKIRKVFGVRASLTGNQAVICSRIIYELFRHLGVKTGAKNKEIPPFALALPKRKAAALLNGLFCGDGSVSRASTLEVNLTSVSRDMVDSVSFLLNRFGIMHTIVVEERDIRSGLILRFYGRPKHVREYKIRIYGKAAAKFIGEIGFAGKKQEKALRLLAAWQKNGVGTPRTKEVGDAFIDRIIKKTLSVRQDEYTYSLTVKPHHTVVVSGITAFQCDADEDCLILLMDALINFSRHYLNETRGGTMDTPLVLSSAIDPREVDDEVHCMECVNSYPLEFYRAAERMTFPSEVKIKTVKDILGTPEQYEGIPITHHCSGIDDAVTRTAYVQLESIPEKIELQFRLQKSIRAVDQRDAAERLILSHFIPDLYGNLRSFSRQTFRCVNCNESYRRVPLAGKCTRCGGNLLLNINKGGITKYLDISRKIIAEYALPDYLKQRLELLNEEIKSVFEDEKVKQMGLSDFV